MIREPAPILDRGQVRVLDRPQPGYWLMRVTKGGPELPAIIEWSSVEPGSDPPNHLDTGPILIASIAGIDRDPLDVWSRRGRAISAPEYRYQMADVAWTREHAPDDPKANPHRPINLLQAKLPF